MDPRTYLRAEGLTALAVALVLYLSIDGPLWLFFVLALAPDLSMLGYLAGPRVGAATYNTAHTYVLPVALGGLGAWTESVLLAQVALVWAAHIGMDRLVGYGLKYEAGFRETHLNRQPPPVGAFTGDDEA